MKSKLLAVPKPLDLYQKASCSKNKSVFSVNLFFLLNSAFTNESNGVSILNPIL
jgi:hypothetical protein